jgi:hypothetical protein
MVVGAHFEQGIVILADSRITLQNPITQRAVSYHDILQKVLPFAPNVAIAFAGGVNCAAFIFTSLNQLMQQNPELQNIAIAGPRLGRDLQRLHQEFSAGVKRAADVAFILAGFSPGTIDPSAGYLFAYRSPVFRPEPIRDKFVVIGTGDVIIPYLAKNWATLRALQPPEMKTKADWMNANLEEELRRHRLLTVGGLFQIILIEPTGIRPMRYGYFSVDPNEDDEAFEMFMEKGFWYQWNMKTGLTTRLERPGQVRIQPARVRDLLPKPDTDDEARTLERARGSLFLNYLVVCGGIQREPGKVEFNPTLNMMASARFPADVQLIVSVSFRAGTGPHLLRLQLVDNDSRVQDGSYEEPVNTDNPIDDIIRDLRLHFVFPHPGVWYLEALVDGHRIARRSFVITEILGELRDLAIQIEDHPDLLRRQNEELARQQLEGVDPVLATGERRSILNYFVPCHENTVDDLTLSFAGMFDVVCTSHFPQGLRIMLSSSLRTAPGTHNVRVDLVDVITKERTTVNSLSAMRSNAYLRDTPIQGETTLVFPRQGVYALEQYVDDELSARSVIAAEDVNNPKFVRLLEADRERVRQGELLVIAKGAQQVPKENLARISAL